MNLAIPAACLLLQAAALTATIAQEIDEESIPEPTQLSVDATAVGADITVVKSLTPIESDDSTAQITLIDVVTIDGKHHSGFKLVLQHAGQIESLYLDLGQVLQLRDEFVAFEAWYETDKTCEASRQCIHGVARCRPSQNVQQAFCPGFYTTSEGAKGVLVSTPHYSFQFPSVEPSAFISAIEAAVGNPKGTEAR